MTLLARVSEEPEEGGVAVAVVEGEIDASNTDEIGARLRTMVTNRHTALVVDLSDTSYLDSAAINLLFALGSAMTERQQALHLVVPSDSPIARALAITGLDSAVAVHETRREAVARA
jgi:anti-sigma B factor antagonist